MASTKVEQLLNDLLSISVRDMGELVEKYMEATGISASMLSAPAASAPAAQSGGSTAEPEVARKKKVILKAAGDKKVQIIKIVKDKLGITLMQAKELVEKENALIKDDMDSADAEKLKAEIEGAGGTVELQ